MGIVDMAMVGVLGASSLAAVGMAGMVTWTAMSLGIALRTGTQTVVSRRLGEKKYSRCGQALQHGHVIAFIVGIPITLLLYCYLPGILESSISEKNMHLSPYAIDYSSFVVLSIYFN